MSLTKNQIEEFKARLIKMKNEFSHQIKSTTAGVRTHEDGQGTAQHQADVASDEFDKTISIEIGSKETQILFQIERALEKIEEGSYGICDVSEKAIPLKRLEAIPYANMTVEAQDQLEKGLL